jgi:hypothetical protein
MLKIGKETAAIKVDVFMMRLRKVMNLRQFAIAPVGKCECTIVAVLGSLSVCRERGGSGSVKRA